MITQNAQELLEAIATAMAFAKEDSTIAIGDLPPDQAPAVDYIDYKEGDDQVWLRLTNGEAWLLQVYPLGGYIPQVYKAGVGDVRSSYNRYQKLLIQWNAIERTLAAGGMKGEDVNTYLQAWHDDTLSDDERADYDRWVSGGKATAAEWAIIDGNQGD